MSGHLWVGGCYRSGTTLLEKLLHGHRQLSVASQPFPDLYFQVKELFLDERGLDYRYPLDHLFLEERYGRTDFDDFLAGRVLDEAEIGRLFDRLAANALGLWTPEIVRAVDEIRPGTFIEVWRQLIAWTARLFDREDAKLAGAKEVLCEEYVPHLLASGVRVILVVRDPRDMVTSLNFRDRDNKTGEHRPVLYSLRAWRKSVAHCIAFEGHPNLRWVRYEDLVRQPFAVLDGLADFLGVAPFDPGWYAEGIRHQDGSIWKGNSSFKDHAGIDPSSLNKYLERMPAHVATYIETCCRPEMLYAGYPVVDDPLDPDEVIASYRDPFAQIHGKFEPDYSSSPEHVAEEQQRLAQLRGRQSLTDDQKTCWYLFAEVFDRLAGHSAA